MNKKIVTGISILALSLPMFAFAQGEVSGTVKAQVGTRTSTTKPKRQVDTVCVQNAIDKRDSTIISGVSTFSASLIMALTARKDALKVAAVMTDKTAREAERKRIWSAFKVSAKTGHTDLVALRKAAWTTYNTDMKACGQTHAETPALVGGSSISL